MKSTSTDNTANKVASILYDIGAIIFRPKQPFRFDSGILSPVYTDNRLIISHPKERKIVTKFLVQKIKEIGIPDIVAGTATAGIPHAAFIAAELNIPMVYVRSQPKDHGKGNQVEGLVRRGQRAIIIEDLISTAGSSVKVAEALRKLGARVTNEVAIFTYRLKASDDNLKKAKIKLTCLTDLKYSVEIAVKKGFLRKDQIQLILDWAKDPKNWGKKMGFE